MSLIFKGYKINGTDLRALEDALAEIKKQVEMRAKRIYNSLLANEIELLVDDIATGLVKNRPTHKSIYDVCVEELNRKISWASGNGVPTPFNFMVQAVIFTYMNDTYIKLNIANASLLKEIKKANGTTPFDYDDNDTNSSVFKTWEDIMGIYSDDNFPMMRQLYPCGPIETSWKNISAHFHSVEERQDMRIRHQLTSELMNMLGMRQQIPDTRLMPYFDEAFMMLSLPAIKEEAARRKARSASVFINITEEMVKQNPNAPAPNTFSDENRS